MFFADSMDLIMLGEREDGVLIPARISFLYREHRCLPLARKEEHHVKQFTWILLGLALSMLTRPTMAVSDPIPTPITKGSITIELKDVANGLVAPNYLTHAADGSGRLFVIDQPGQVYLIENGQRRTEPFLDLSSRLVTLGANSDERGLLGLAFHPGFADSASSGYRKLYTYTSEPVTGTADFTVLLPGGGGAFDHQSVVAEWEVDPINRNRVAMNSRREVLRIDQPQANHNGGMIDFGPNGNLYIALGDGGGSNDNASGHGQNGNGQTPANVLGSFLRIDVDGSNSGNGQYGIPAANPFLNDGGVPDETYAFGFRNPFRFSFDNDTGRLIVADVGQNNIEEVDIVTAGGNFGWRLKEGSFAFDFSDGSISDDLSGLPAGLIDPVLEYDHDEGIAVIGGFVYRGSSIPELAGKYVFGDFLGRLFKGDLDSGEIEELIIGDRDELGLLVKGFGQDAEGELYLLASVNGGPTGDTGQVFQLTAIPLPGAIWLLISSLAGLAVLSRRQL